MSTNTKREAATPRHEWGIRDYVALAIRGRWTIIFTFVIVFGAAVLYSVLAAPVYRAVASIKIDMRQLQSTVFRDYTSPLNSLNVIQNELQVLKSYTLAEIAAKKLLEKKFIDDANQIPMQIVESSKNKEGEGGYASLSEVTSRVKGAVDFEPVRDSDVIKLIASSGNPREAVLIANLYAEAYFQRNTYATRTKSRTFREFLESQLHDRQLALGQAEESVRKFMEQKGVVSLDEESRKVIEQLSQLEAQRDAVDISVHSLEGTVSSYREQMAQQELNVAKVMGEANDPYIRVMQSQLAQLEVQRDITVAQNPAFVDKELYNTKLNEIDDQIHALKARLKKRTDEFLLNILPGNDGASGGESNPAGYLKQVKQKMLESQIELQSLRARKDALNAAIKEYNRQFENLPRKNMDFARLQREKMSNEKLFLAIQEKYNEANINEQSELGYIDIFDPAVPPGGPSSPRVGLNLLLGFVGGLGLGFLFVFVKEQMRDTIRTPEDVKRHGVNVLTTVAVMSNHEGGVDGQRERLVGKAVVNPNLIMISNPLSPVAESYRRVRTSLNFLHAESPPKIILVTSPEPGEGKTTTVCNLAIAFAQAGRSVLLVDADMRLPAVHTMFDIGIQPGLSEFLAGKATMTTIEHQSSVPHLSIIASGTIPSNPVESLESEAMKKFISLVRTTYDVVLLDSPPILPVTDTLLLSALSDSILVVISSGSTSAASLERAKEAIGAAGSRITGVIINNFDLVKAYGVMYKHAGYGDYYGYSSGGTRG